MGRTSPSSYASAGDVTSLEVGGPLTRHHGVLHLVARPDLLHELRARMPAHGVSGAKHAVPGKAVHFPDRTEFHQVAVRAPCRLLSLVVMDMLTMWAREVVHVGK